jgi:hypothetical protein
VGEKLGLPFLDVLPFEPAATLLGVLDGEVPGSMGELESRYGKALRAAVAGTR